jgi:hypothetical protein
MDADAGQIARIASARLADTVRRPDLELEVARRLANVRNETVPARYEPVSLGIAAVVISAAALAWPIIRELRNDRKTPNPEVIARRVRVLLTDQYPETPPHERNLIVEVVVEEAVSRTDQYP